jgi:endonuclease YncB( thermonuclease family)
MADDLATATDDVPEFSLAGKTLAAKVVDCYYGDTFDIVVRIFDQLLKFKCRMDGYDAPEMKPPKTKAPALREAEKAAALKSKQALLSQVCNSVPATAPQLTNQQLADCLKRNTRLITVQCLEFDKYGRLLVRVPLEEGVTVNEWMIAKGYGYAYTGGARVTFSGDATATVGTTATA